MKITVSGNLDYRYFYFPAALFHKHVVNKFARIFVDHSSFERDLTPQARLLGAEILALGGFEEVVFRSGNIQVWSHRYDEFTPSVINQIKDLIYKHYGTPEADKVVYLPFGYKLILPRK